MARPLKKADVNGVSADRLLVARLEVVRTEAGMSQSEFSRRAGYGSEYWYRVAAGMHAPSLAAFCDHAAVLGYNFRLMRDA
jgi:transcriptional regulator with XRE-family HTH domain